MILQPCKGISEVPTRIDAIREVCSISVGQDFIELANAFPEGQVQTLLLPPQRFLSYYMFDAKLVIGFNGEHIITDVEFRNPDDAIWGKGLHFNGINLFQPSLKSVIETLTGAGIGVEVIDVGLDAPDIGVSFFSDDFDEDLDVKLDSVTVSLDCKAPI